MDIIPLLVFLGVGILAGLIGGSLGLRGGVVTIPALLFIFPAVVYTGKTRNLRVEIVT